MFVLAIVIGLAVLILSFVALHYIRLAQRAKIKKKPLSSQQEQVLRSHPSWQCLEPEHKEKWKQHINVFLDEKNLWDFETKASLDLDNQTRVAAEACLPLINRKTNYYGQISDIYYNRETRESTNAQNQAIDWSTILYDQYCREISNKSFSKEEFGQKSEQFLRGELNSPELEKFYGLNPQSAST